MVQFLRAQALGKGGFATCTYKLRVVCFFRFELEHVILNALKGHQILQNWNTDHDPIVKNLTHQANLSASPLGHKHHQQLHELTWLSLGDLGGVLASVGSLPCFCSSLSWQLLWDWLVVFLSLCPFLSLCFFPCPYQRVSSWRGHDQNIRMILLPVPVHFPALVLLCVGLSVPSAKLVRYLDGSFHVTGF